MDYSSFLVNNMDDKGKVFWQWLKDNGVTISDKVTLHDYSSQGQGRGVIATDDIEKKELIFSIPQKFTMAVQNDPAFAKLVSGENDNGTWLNLMVYMMTCASNSHWKPYFDLLPSKFNTPMFWDPSTAKELLQGSALIDKIGKEEAEQQWGELAPLFKDKLFQGCDTSVDAFHRMGSLIMSYSFDVEPPQAAEDNKDDEDDDDEEEEYEPVKAMCPPADMLNAHTRLCNAHLTHNHENNSLDMVAIKPIPKGSQVYNTYGELPNSDLLRRYGYVESGGTKFDVVEVPTSMIADSVVKLGHATEDQMQKTIQELEEDEENEIYDDAYDIGVNGEPDVPNWVMLEYLGLIHDVPDHATKLIKQSIKLAENDKLSDRACEIWQATLQARIEQYPKHAQDLAAKDPNPEPTDDVIVEPEKMANEVLAGEIRILQRSLAWCKAIDTIPAQEVIDKVLKPPKKART